MLSFDNDAAIDVIPHKRKLQKSLLEKDYSNIIKMKKSDFRTPHFNRVTMSHISQIPKIALNHNLHSELLQKTQSHIETIAQIGLSKKEVTKGFYRHICK